MHWACIIHGFENLRMLKPTHPLGKGPPGPLQTQSELVGFVIELQIGSSDLNLTSAVNSLCGLGQATPSWPQLPSCNAGVIFTLLQGVVMIGAS